MQELAINRTELQAKAECCDLLKLLLSQKLRAIRGLDVKRLGVTHSWHKSLSAYANPRSPFTVLVKGGKSIPHASVVQLYKSIRHELKGVGGISYFWSRSGIVVAIGVDTDLKRLQNLTELL